MQDSRLSKSNSKIIVKKKMTTKQIENWKLIRALRRKHFIWFHGVLLWGMLVGVSYFIIMYLNNRELFLALIISLVIFPIVGFFWASEAWKKNERKFRIRLELD